ncbi:hypothetical protein GGI04_002908 [Coemansia thaxteri]|nr:hypothetical protein GGI04_002908 [Coemansia thaxteri]
MKIFDGCCAWFAPSVPTAHINTWLADGGVKIRDVSKSIVQYYFSNALDDDTTIELLRHQEKVVYRSSWITDSSLSRTRQPLGSYALYESRMATTASASSFRSPSLAARRPHTVHSSRRVGLLARSASQHHATPSGNRGMSTGLYGGSPPAQPPHFYSPSMASANAQHSANRRPRSVAGDFYAADYYARLRENASETQSVRSRSSRLSNASSIISSYGRRQHVVSRFVIHADHQTRASIINDVADFTPNAHDFVAYKIPKLSR